MPTGRSTHYELSLSRVAAEDITQRGMSGTRSTCNG
jgi:hypothetical protein